MLKDKFLEFRGKKLFRIRALRDFSYIKKGDIGGYIESERNLGHRGKCWVHSEAMVFEKARVIDDAVIAGRAKVSGLACVCERVRVYENAFVHGESLVGGDVRVYGYADICGEAEVDGTLHVYDQVTICDGSRVFGSGSLKWHDTHRF